jgi:two-component system OmpR family sensor kinase
MPQDNVPVLLDRIARDALGEVQPLAQQRRIHIEFDALVEITVKGDAEALRVLVRNLLDNAVRYSPEGSVVRLRVVRDSKAAAVLEVSDQGPGIAPEDRSRAFARFYRAPGASAEGSGLGLAIVKAIAQRHAAQVTLGDAEPQGLRVEVSFPGP